MAVVDEAREKLNRANTHLAELADDERVYFGRKPYEFAFEDDPEVEKQVIVRLLVHEKPPARWGVILGDFLSNARAVLDYIASALDRSVGGAGDKIYFPLYHSRDSFQKHAAKKIRHLDLCHRALIESVQPFKLNWGPIERHPGAILGRLSGPDKHQRLTPTIIVPQTFRVTVNVITTSGERYSTETFQQAEGWDLEHNTVLTHVNYASVADVKEVQVQPHLDIRMEVEPGVTTHDAVNGVFVYVASVFETFEPILATLD